MTRDLEFNHQRKKYMYIELEIFTLAVVYIKLFKYNLCMKY